MQPRNICSAMFTNLQIKFANKVVKNCCKSNDFYLSIDDLDSKMPLTDNSEYMRRKISMVKDDVLPEGGCDTCIKDGGNIINKTWNRWSIKEKNDELDNNLLYNDLIDNYEFAMSNICDLKCVYCHPKDSSSWAKEMGMTLIQVDQSWQSLVLEKTMKSIENKMATSAPLIFLFSGGEPTYNTDTYEIIKTLLSMSADAVSSNITFVIHSNGNMKPKVLEKYLLLIRSNSEVKWRFDFSFDGIGEVCEAIRYGLNWDRAISNIRIILAEPNASVKISPTISLYSVPYLAEQIEFFADLLEECGEKTTFMFNKNAVMEPEMAATTLPDSFKQYIDKAIEICHNRGIFYFDFLQKIKDQVGTDFNPKSIKKVKTKFEYFKEKRPDVDWEKLFPHVVNLIEDNQTLDGKFQGE